MPDAIPTRPCSGLSHPRMLSINTAGYTRHTGQQLDCCTVGLKDDVRVILLVSRRVIGAYLGILPSPCR